MEWSSVAWWRASPISPITSARSARSTRRHGVRKKGRSKEKAAPVGRPLACALPAAFGSAAVDQVAQAADAIEDRALFLAPSLVLRRRGVDAIGHAAERQRLQPHAAGPL